MKSQVYLTVKLYGGGNPFNVFDGFVEIGLQ